MMFKKPYVLLKLCHQFSTDLVTSNPLIKLSLSIYDFLMCVCVYIYSRRRPRWTCVSPSSTILRSAYMALNTLQQDWLL